MKMKRKIYHINTTYVDLGLDKDTTIVIIKCLSVVMLKSIKQHLSNI